MEAAVAISLILRH